MSRELKRLYQPVLLARDGQLTGPLTTTGALTKALALWKALRPRHWVKNLFVIAPVIYSQNLLVPSLLLRSLTAFFIFCLISSSVYLLNDIRDREEDRLHPKKRHRPIASGQVRTRLALLVMGSLLVIALAGAVTVGKAFATIVAIYWAINLFYSIWLKRLVILDVFVIASGFLLRVMAGGAAIQVEMSHWLLLCTVLLALFLGFSKRRHELISLREDASNHRRVLNDYSPQFLDMMIGIVTASTVMSYALYTVSEETVRRFNTEALLFTVPFVLYGIFRYLYLLYHQNQGGDPIESIVSDWSMKINLLLWLTVTGIVIYSNGPL